MLTNPLRCLQHPNRPVSTIISHYHKHKSEFPRLTGRKSAKERVRVASGSELNQSPPPRPPPTSSLLSSTHPLHHHIDSHSTSADPPSSFASGSNSDQTRPPPLPFLTPSSHHPDQPPSRLPPDHPLHHRPSHLSRQPSPQLSSSASTSNSESTSYLRNSLASSESLLSHSCWSCGGVGRNLNRLELVEPSWEDPQAVMRFGRPVCEVCLLLVNLQIASKGGEFEVEFLEMGELEKALLITKMLRGGGGGGRGERWKS